MRPKLTLLPLLLFSYLLYSGCQRSDLDVLPFVVTLPPVLAELGSVQLKGEVRSGFSGNIPDHGFVYSSSNADPTMNAAGVNNISLNGRTDSGSFETLLTNLSLQEPVYYVRAYVTFMSETVYGEVENFSFTLNLTLSENIVVQNDTAILEGIVFGLERFNNEVSEHGFVYSNTGADLIAGAVETNDLMVRDDDGSFSGILSNLEFNSQYAVRAFVKFNGEYIYSNEKSFMVNGGWKLKSPLDRGTWGGIAVQSGNRIFVGGGCEDAICDYTGGGYVRNFWEFDPLANNGLGAWYEEATFVAQDDFGFFLRDPRRDAIAFQINNTIYYGLGKIGDQGGTIYYADLYALTPKEGPEKGEWVSKQGLNSRLEKAVAFSVGGKAYVGTGLDENQNLVKSFYEFDPDGNGGNGSWRPIADFTGDARANAVAFVIGNTAYVGAGSEDAEGVQIFNDFYKFIPPANDSEMGNWEKMASLDNCNLDAVDRCRNTTAPQSCGRDGAVAFSIDQKGYFGSGFLFNGINGAHFYDFYEYQPEENGPGRWTLLERLPGNSRTEAIGIGFSSGTVQTGYIGFGNRFACDDIFDIYPDLWEYTPKK